ncbi:MAG: sigma-54-dependent Fis family transcriptional regulator [Bradymonadales bacterium]|nr:MAG: sigma-54-dependent Fis family transcriptional regulator [Bradymonadales bacterium]
MSVEPESLKKPKILVVDDELSMVRSLELLLRPLGDVIKAYSVPEAEEFLDQSVDCIVTDVSMPEASGLKLLDSFRSRQPDLPIIIMTAYSSVPEAVEAIQRGAYEYLTKPFSNEEMLAVVKAAIQRRGLLAGETRQLPEGWVCNSIKMREFLSKAERLVESSQPVLIFGQTGSGKRRAARWIAERRGALKTFLSVEYPPREESHPILESSIEKYSDLYLAEVFSLSPRLQDRLMQLVEEKGVRLIAGSSSAPELQGGEAFREDLRELLQRQVLRLPSLEERREDVEAVCQQLLEAMRAEMRMPQLKLDEEALAALGSHRFVENFRELERILQRAAIESKTGLIRKGDLQFRETDLDQILPFSIPVEQGWGRLEFLYRGLEKELIERAVKKYPEASNTQIASILGTTRRILELRMKSYDIQES